VDRVLHLDRSTACYLAAQPRARDVCRCSRSCRIFLDDFPDRASRSANRGRSIGVASCLGRRTDSDDRRRSRGIGPDGQAGLESSHRRPSVSGACPGTSRHVANARWTLLSAPLIERGAGHVPDDIKASANVWFRHVLLPVYPLGSALIASSKAAGLNVYGVIPAMVPSCIVIVMLGVVFLLRRTGVPAGPPVREQEAFSWRGLLVPLMLILTAPVIDLVIAMTCRLPTGRSERRSESRQTSPCLPLLDEPGGQR